MIDKMGTLQTVIVIVALASFGVEASDEIDREAEVRVAVNIFGRAFLEADVPTLSSLLTEDYVHVNGGSGNVLNREEWLDWMTSRRTEMDSGKLVIDVYRMEDIEIVLDGNTAIVFGLVRSSQTRNGTASTAKIRFSNTWLYRKGSWRRAAFHDSPLP